MLAWGTNFLGEAGNGGSGDQVAFANGFSYNDYPVQASGLSNVIAISAGAFSSAAIVRGYALDGTPDPALNTVWTWGDAEDGQLGARPTDGCNDQLAITPCAKGPLQVHGPDGTGFLMGIVAIAEGGDHVLALRDDGTVWAWGDDSAGQLGMPPPSSRISGCPTTIAVAPGEVSRADPGCVPYPVQVPRLSGVTAIAASEAYSVAIVHQGGSGPDDTVWVWGDNTVGQLGQGQDCNQGPSEPGALCSSANPKPVPTMQGVAAIAAGNNGQTMAIIRGQSPDGSDNQLWTWGGVNQWGESGINVNGAVTDAKGLPTPIDSPTRVLDASGTGYFAGAVSVATGFYDTVALKLDPVQHTTTVWDWGEFTAAASGVPPGARNDWQTPHEVRGPGGTGFLTGGVAVATSHDSSYMLKSDGTVWGWGDDEYGELAVVRPTTAFSNIAYQFPVQARGVSGATAISGGWEHVLALGNLPPPPPPVVKQQPSTTPPVLPFEQLPGSVAPGQPPQPPATVPVVNPGVAPSTVNPPPQQPAPVSVSSQPISTPVQAVSAAQAPAAQVQAPISSPVQGSQLVAGTAAVPGSPAALAPSVGDRQSATDQLAMLRHDDAQDTAWAVGIAGAAAAALIVCVVAMAHSRRPPSIRSAPAWAPWGSRPRAFDDEPPTEAFS